MEAFELYRSVLGGEFVGVNRYSEMPPDVQVPTGDTSKIMHIALQLEDGQGIMGSDRPPATGSTTFGDSVHISISPGSSEEARRIFEGLAAGGEVTMPYERQFWGAEYGQLTDRYGIRWQVNYQLEDARA